MKSTFHSVLALALMSTASNALANEGEVTRIEKQYENGSSIVMTCAPNARAECVVEVLLEGVPARYSVDFAKVGEVPTMEHIALLNHSSNPFGGTFVVSVECSGRAVGFVPDAVHSVQCLKYVYLSGFHAITWGSTLVMGRLEPVEIN